MTTQRGRNRYSPHAVISGCSSIPVREARCRLRRQSGVGGGRPPAVDDDLPYPFVNEPVAAAIWLRAMSVQFCVLFRQLSTSQAMTDGLQTFQKSACIEY